MQVLIWFKMHIWNICTWDVGFLLFVKVCSKFNLFLNTAAAPSPKSGGASHTSPRTDATKNGCSIFFLKNWKKKKLFEPSLKSVLKKSIFKFRIAAQMKAGTFPAFYFVLHTQKSILNFWPDDHDWLIDDWLITSGSYELVRWWSSGPSSCAGFCFCCRIWLIFLSSLKRTHFPETYLSLSRRAY